MMSKTSDIIALFAVHFCDPLNRRTRKVISPPGWTRPHEEEETTQTEGNPELLLPARRPTTPTQKWKNIAAGAWARRRLELRVEETRRGKGREREETKGYGEDREADEPEWSARVTAPTHRRRARRLFTHLSFFLK